MVLFVFQFYPGYNFFINFLLVTLRSERVKTSKLTAGVGGKTIRRVEIRYGIPGLALSLEAGVAGKFSTL